MQVEQRWSVGPIYGMIIHRHHQVSPVKAMSDLLCVHGRVADRCFLTPHYIGQMNAVVGIST